MIESIEIKNFRCFKDTKIAKFGLVNLIGGLNNAGKTALLEAIMVVTEPKIALIKTLWMIRGGSEKFAMINSENTWDSFFYQNNKNHSIQIKSITDGELGNEVLMTCDENIEDISSFFPSTLMQRDREYVESLTIRKKSVLHIIGKQSLDNLNTVLIANQYGVGGSGSELSIKERCYLCSVYQKRTGSELAMNFQKLEFNGKESPILEAIKIIDDSIEKIEFFAIGEPNLYLTKKDGVRLPLGSFGDAINIVMEIVLAILDESDRVVLIDEIENGIHYTNQAKLWEMLFQLAIKFNVQIFSTSHSLEMIKAFAKVAQQFPEQAAYFEMARHAKTGNIVGLPIPIDVLEYDIQNNAPFRGE